MKFRDYIYSKTKLKAFFDANDIADGHQFEQEIKKHIDHSAFVLYLIQMNMPIENGVEKKLLLQRGIDVLSLALWKNKRENNEVSP